MLTNFSYYQILGLPLLAWIGIIGILLLLTAGYIGYLSYTGKVAIPVKTHKLIAGTAMLIGLVHATLAVLSFLK